MNLTNPQKILYFMVYATNDGRLTCSDRDVLVQRYFFKDKKAISDAIYRLSKDGLVEKRYGYWTVTRHGLWYIKNVCDEKSINTDKVMLDKTFATNDTDYNDYDEDYGIDDEDEDSALNDDIEEDPDDSDFFATAEDDVDDEPNATTSHMNDCYKHMADAFKYMADAFGYMKDAFSRL